MKGKIILSILLLLFISCKKVEENKRVDIKSAENDSVPKHGRIFFEYDKIDHYKNEIDSIYELTSNREISKLNNLKSEIVLGDKPKDLNDTEFFKSLEKIGYKKSEISQSKFEEINKIFVEKTVSQNLDYACPAVYRDILIFRKQNKTVGIAKICFECFKSQIIGTKANTENFGQNGDYEKLEEILKN
ncbi:MULTISPECIES: hypothetical protein [Weeksellaceae]|uniref:Lipoprotein n=1 Tax=Riemerella anatipestifer TaxID=34085 RepID=A0AAP3EZY1_RIEAN|nr:MULTISPECIES: hypothetical protein [Weeksellaceae]AZZ57708.1 hypothetical protein AWB57_00865 [Riemerella anatipestifer]MBT0550675.1 hypothetical protein [Riemerella anatipestifer]MBT0553621.1 hypothetical protein [Riemerella anatipestifer]MBT0572165.1 hypothetical protein [Riemerella anatipestifer]MCE3024442.1 hypothetical protein [Riemerella anatipestifer]